MDSMGLSIYEKMCNIMNARQIVSSVSDKPEGSE